MLKHSIVFKKTEHFEIYGDLYEASRKNAPVVLYLHGGALITGSRSHFIQEQLQLYHDAGFAVFSIDYRLAPETKLPEIAMDIRDALQWLMVEGQQKYDIDSDNIAVIGKSAGGYLALLAGTFEARPKAVVSFFGYGDIIGDWYAKPSLYYCQKPMVSREEACEFITDHPVTEDADKNRSIFYLRCRQQGTWIPEVVGKDPLSEQTDIYAYCPVRHVAKDYPPTLLLHGDVDTDVPYEQSVMMADALEQAGVPHKLITISNGGHGFDRNMDQPVVQEAFLEVVDFLRKYLHGENQSMY
ncbi:alpha/beta hydrolase [Paenibacillus koleovorans]|uniref:alpha/beta hydrolase n=1 Tax=Paenibacillus koleovorans TaxID=121608 RepID=UPI000FD9AF4A|nr:alpha/beta hydrolase [Paenibacillus koleovorans]